MEYRLDFGGLKRLCHKAGNAAFAAAELAGAAAEAVRSRAEHCASRLRLTRVVRDIEEEIDLELREVGELLYATHRGTPSDSDDIQEILEYVDSLYEELDGHRRELRRLDGAAFCGACGTENQSGDVYCRGCGLPLGRE